MEAAAEQTVLKTHYKPTAQQSYHIAADIWTVHTDAKTNSKPTDVATSDPAVRRQQTRTSLGKKARLTSLEKVFPHFAPSSQLSLRLSSQPSERGRKEKNASEGNGDAV